VRAGRLVQFKNLEFNKGNKALAPDCVLPLSKVVDNLRDLGLGVGINSGIFYELSV
jgi:hypothetical protein